MPQQLPLLLCHSLLIVQLLENLIDNAIKYSPPDQPVRVTAVKDAKHIAFAVTDKGSGVAPELSQTIFEAFERIEPERLGLWQMQDPTAQGVGIGLTLCQAIAIAHEGSITLTAQPGQGSTFTVRLPIRDNLSAPREV
ncbi:MAG: sensor histidine kinase [Oxalobacteraceae bacterium]